MSLFVSLDLCFWHNVMHAINQVFMFEDFILACDTLYLYVFSNNSTFNPDVISKTKKLT